MSGAFEPVEDVGAAGVVDLVKRVSIRLLYSHSVAAGREDANKQPVAIHDTQQQKNSKTSEVSVSFQKQKITRMLQIQTSKRC